MQTNTLTKAETAKKLIQSLLSSKWLNEKNETRANTPVEIQFDNDCSALAVLILGDQGDTVPLRIDEELFDVFKTHAEQLPNILKKSNCLAHYFLNIEKPHLLNILPKEKLIEVAEHYRWEDLVLSSEEIQERKVRKLEVEFEKLLQEKINFKGEEKAGPDDEVKKTPQEKINSFFYREGENSALLAFAKKHITEIEDLLKKEAGLVLICLRSKFLIDAIQEERLVEIIYKHAGRLDSSLVYRRLQCFPELDKKYMRYAKEKQTAKLRELAKIQIISSFEKGEILFLRAGIPATVTTDRELADAKKICKNLHERSELRFVLGILEDKELREFYHKEYEKYLAVNAHTPPPVVEAKAKPNEVEVPDANASSNSLVIGPLGSSTLSGCDSEVVLGPLDSVSAVGPSRSYSSAVNSETPVAPGSADPAVTFRFGRSDSRQLLSGIVAPPKDQSENNTSNSQDNNAAKPTSGICAIS